MNVSGLGSLPSLGFGTAGLGINLSERHALHLLDVAFENGIFHFDTAPLYGAGLAEHRLGKYLRHKREQVTVATKVGLTASRSRRFIARTLRYRSLRRSMLSRTPRQIRSALPLDNPGRYFQASDGIQSLERSLKALKTDCVDMVWLHEATAEETLSDEWRDFAARAQAAGMTKEVGVTLRPEEAQRLSDRGYRGPLQTAYSITSPWGSHDPRQVIFVHSAISSSFHVVGPYLTSESESGRGENSPRHFRHELAELLLAEAMDSTGGCVLFSSKSPERIQSASRSLRTSQNEVEAFRQWVRQLRLPDQRVEPT